MLVLRRKLHETVIIGTDITVTVVELSPSAVRLGITAPEEVQVDRLEVRERKESELGGES